MSRPRTLSTALKRIAALEADLDEVRANAQRLLEDYRETERKLAAANATIETLGKEIDERTRGLVQLRIEHVQCAKARGHVANLEHALAACVDVLEEDAAVAAVARAKDLLSTVEKG